MEHKQFTSDDLEDPSPESSQGFQVDRFFKKTVNLNIPDTILENCSGELSGDSLKMEAAKTIIEAFNDEDERNISTSQSDKFKNDSLNSSTIIAIDNSFIKQCERKLLENSNIEDDISVENKSLVNKNLLGVPRMAVYANDTISTPPSALRKEISILRNEMAEAHEFHDLEIQLLKEEKLQNEADSYNYSDIISKMTEKYSSLMELYTNLKSEYENYRSEQEQMRKEIQSKTADCLETLCSQIEASDNSLNCSSVSLISFNGGIRSSTMMEDMTEVEATILQDATILANDPLSITNDGVFKTPMQTPLNSAKKLFLEKSNEKPIVREVKEIIAKRDPLDSEYNLQLLNVEAALHEKIKEVEDLEQRLFKVEDMSSLLQSELERITTQNSTLQENLTKKTNQLNELTQKLFTETISLNPSLRDSLIDIPETKLLFVFIETIMESCRKIQEEEITKHNFEKSEWEAKRKADTTEIENLRNQLSSNFTEIDDLKKKLSDTENTILTRDEEILILQSHVSNLKQTREDFAYTRETLLELESKLTLTEAEKTAAENRYRELETLVESLKTEIETNKTTQTKLEEENSKMKSEVESNDVLKLELMTVKEKLTSTEEAAAKLKSQLESIEFEKLELENRITEFESIQVENDNLKQQISESNYTSVELKSQVEALESEKLELENRCSELENFRIENENLKQRILETEKLQNTLTELNSQIESLESEKSELQNRCAELKNTLTENNNNLQQVILETEKTSAELRSQLEILESKRSDLENRCTELENFQNENEKLKQQISESEKISVEFKSQLELLESKKAELENRCAELENDNSKLKVFESEKLELEYRYTGLENIRIENENLKQQISESERTSAELKSQLETIESKKTELENRCAELENDNSKLKVFETEKLELENRYGELENIRVENENLKQQISETERTLAEFKSQLELLESKKAELENRCAVLENDNSKLKVFESEKLELEHRCTGLENIRIENENLKERILENEKASEELKAQLELLESEKLDLENRCAGLENLRIENEKRSEELKSQLETIESKRLDLENRCTDFENIQIENNSLKERISEMAKTSEELKSQIESLESEKLYLENRCAGLENLRIENEKASEELNSQLETIESKKLELEDRCTDFENIQIENNSLKERILEMTKTSEELKSQIESIESENLEFKNRCVELQKILNENENLKQQSLETDKTLVELKSQVEALKSKNLELENVSTENNNLKQRIFEIEEESVKLQNHFVQLENISNENDYLKQRVSEMGRRCEELKSQIESFESEKLGFENRCIELQKALTQNDNLKMLILESEKCELQYRYENIRTENENFKKQILESEKTSEMLKSQIELLTSEKLDLEKHVENIQIESKKTSAELENRCLELQKILTENDNLKQRIFESEKLELENRCSELKNVRFENENLKQQIFETEKMITALKTELELQKEDEVKNINKIEDLNREIDQLKKHSDEVVDAVEETKNKLTDLLSGCELNRELPSERITKFFENSKLKELKVVSIFMKTVRKTCEGVENELLRNFDSKKQEWETQKDLLYEQISESLNEKENLLKLHKEKDNQLADREKEIKTLQEQQNQLELTENQQRELIENLRDDIKAKEKELMTLQENLMSAEEAILLLKSQIKSFEVEKTQAELENNSNCEKIQTENDDLKQRILHSEKMLTELQNELHVAKEDQKNNIIKVEELIREVDELKKENNGFSHAVEETRNLADVLSEDANDSDLPGDRITKLMAKTSKGETKIVSDFVETITKTCKGVQNEMIKKFDSKKLEWETQKGVDLQNLRQQIELLTEANKRLEADVCQTKNELTIADEMIVKLKSQLTSAEIEKAEAVESLKIEIDTKETIIKGLDEMKNLRENENCCLKKQLKESEDEVVCLKNLLATAEEKISLKDAKMQELIKEVDTMKKDMEFVSEKLEKVEKSNRNLMEVLSDVQTHLNIPDDNLLACENKKIFSEKINAFVKSQLEGLETENKNLKIGNENLKEKVKQLTKLIGETELKNANASQPNGRTKVGKNIDLCVRRLDKLEEINHNLTELLTRILTMMEFADLEKLKFCSVREFPNVMKKVVAHVNGFLGKMKEMKEENVQLDEECETYSNIIKDLKKEAAAVWKENKEKTEAFEAEIERLKKEKNSLEKEKEDLAGKISKLNEENSKLKSKTEGTLHTCTCGNEYKKINELKRTILVKEQKLLELQDLEAQTNSFKSQIEYLKAALEREKKKIGEEKEKNKKLQSELNEATKNQKTENKKPEEENQVLDELRMRGSISGGIVQEFVDKEKMRKLSKDIGILKELCRSRYAEIKRLEAVNAALKNGAPKNSNQMDSPICSKGYNTRSKNQVRDFWKTEISGKENSAV